MASVRCPKAVSVIPNTTSMVRSLKRKFFCCEPANCSAVVSPSFNQIIGVRLPMQCRVAINFYTHCCRQ